MKAIRLSDLSEWLFASEETVDNLHQICQRSSLIFTVFS